MQIFSFLGFILFLSTATITRAGDVQCTFTESNQTGRAQLDFTVQLYKKIVAANQNKNIIFSPVSIILALSLLEAGASGQTQTDLKKILAPTGYTGDVSQLYQSVQHQLKIRDDKAALSVANALYYKNDLVLKPEYLSKIKNCFETEISSLDFSQSEPARNKINQWISNQTAQKISELIKPGVLTPDTSAVLANAIYFKAAWEEKLQMSNDLIDFHPSGQGNQVQKAKFMTRQAKYAYAEDADLQLVELSYANIPVSMYIVKAKAPNTSIDAVESKITSEKVIALARSRTMRKVNLQIPPFEIRLPTKLSDILKQLGLANIFSDQADFSRMDPSNRIKVSDVVHEAYIKVNENGTEAAAATAVIMGEQALLQHPPEMPVQFIANYPFYFSIIHKPTRSTLFRGKVNTIKADQ